MAKNDKPKQARLLRDAAVDGVGYKINQVVEFPADLAKALQDDGTVDADADAVDYALSLGNQSITHTPAGNDVAQADNAA